jgi:hypothetical protein
METLREIDYTNEKVAENNLSQNPRYSFSWQDNNC